MIKDKILEIYAPVSGKTQSIETVPDQVFAQKTIGDGISIAPSSFVLCAPCDGTIVNIHSSKHALTLQTQQGIDILMHVGLDTVLLRGAGFDLKVAVGQTVKKGDCLIAFDHHIIEKNGKSLLTEIVVANMEQTAGITAMTDKDVQAGKDIILTVALKKNAQIIPMPSVKGMKAESWEIEIKNPAGLHARPAAVLVNAAKRFASQIALTCAGKSADAKSLTAIMGLDIKNGDRVRLTVEGYDASEAMKKLIPLIETGLGEELSAAPVVVEEPKELPKGKDQENLFFGIAASPGMAVGVAVRLQDAAIEVEEFGASPSKEREKLASALAEAGDELNDLYEKTLKKAGPDKAAIFSAHQELLEDPELVKKSQELIDNGRSAAFAWQQTINKQAQRFAEMKNSLLAERAGDLQDVGKRVLRLLTGEVEQKVCLPENAVVIAYDLTPSDTALLDRDKVVGFATVSGGASSHAAILARSMMLPAVSGLSESVLKILNGTPVLLNGTTGELHLNPDEKEKQSAVRQKETERKTQAELFETRNEPAVTTDGVRLEIVGNIGSAEEAGRVAAAGGEGIGLLRSEFLFLNRQEAPSEAEQTAVYRAVGEAMGPNRPVIVRTLDIGGDKEVPYIKEPKEDNPFLGVRGLRLSLKHQELFRSQIRAILKAADKTKIRIMFPMITILEEVKLAKQIVEEERKALNAPPVETGIMIEVPAAAMTADILAPYVDFFSIGTNDLTQYTMACDRGNPALSSLSDGLHPAVLRMIKMTVEGAEKHGKWVGVCGAMAGDQNAVPVLIGLGVKELSVVSPLIPGIKAQIRSLSMSRCQDLARLAVGQESIQDVYQIIKSFLTDQQRGE
ncbi:MAG: phosphoenolpyruvate--protein phosphotransferase [Alphaproteobacteria bacterium]|nr:phosphoenolpyruvate--protein phosphotransferase [Alphaproteobacteria bacterium]